MFFPFSLSVSLNLLDLHVAIDRLRARVLISRLLPRYFSLVDRRLHSLLRPPLEFGHFILDLVSWLSLRLL